MTKAGPGTLALTGTNLYTGNTTVAGGTLVAQSAAELPNYATSGNVAVASGATLQINFGGPSDWTAAQVASPGLLSAGNLAKFASGLTLAFDTTNAPTGGTYTTAISGSLGIQKVGSNALYLGATSNTYTGNTTLTSGILSIERTSSGNGLSPFGTGTLFLNGGSLSAWAQSGSLYYPYFTNVYQINASIGLGDTTSGGTASLDFAGPGTINVANPTLTVNSVNPIYVGGANGTVNTLVDNGNGFTKGGPGKMIMASLVTQNATAAISGPITINGGTVQFGSANNGQYTMGTPTVTVNNSGVAAIGTNMALWRTDVILNNTSSLTLVGLGYVSYMGGLQGGTSATTIDVGPGQHLNLENGFEFHVGFNNVNETFNGNFIDTNAAPNSAVVKEGTGMWTLTGVSSLTGTTYLKTPLGVAYSLPDIYAPSFGLMNGGLASAPTATPLTAARSERARCISPVSAAR